MKLPKCIYGGETQEQLNQALRQLHDEVRKLTERRIDGFNLADSILGDGLEFTAFTSERPGVIRNSLADTTGNTYITLKGDGAVPENNYGVEVVVDASNSTYGRFCIRDKDSDNQLVSIIPDDPASADPGGILDFPRGIGRIRTSADYNLRLQRNSTTLIELGSTEITASEDINPISDNVYTLGRTGVSWLEAFVGTIDSGSDSNLILQRNNVTKLTIQTAQILSADDINPDTTNTYDLGTASLAWKEIYTRNLDTDGANDLVIARNNITKLTVASAQITAADDIIPSVNTSFDLGSASFGWSQLYINVLDTAGNLSMSFQQNNNTRITLQTAGQVSFNTGIDLIYGSTSSDINLDEGDCFTAVDASGAARTVNLPAISGAQGRIYIIKKIDATANAVIIDGSGAETIDGAATYNTVVQYATTIIVGGTSEWHKVGSILF